MRSHICAWVVGAFTLLLLTPCSWALKRCSFSSTTVSIRHHRLLHAARRLDGSSEQPGISAHADKFRGRRDGRSSSALYMAKKKKSKVAPSEVQDLMSIINERGPDTNVYGNFSRKPMRAEGEDEGQVMFPELEQTGIDEKKLRESPFGKVLFGVLDVVFPVFKEPNWFDLYDPPLSKQANMDLPYFDGYDFVNSTWTIYIRHRFGVFNWLDRMGFIPQTVMRCFLRGDGKTMWNDGFYGEWYINPAINYFQLEKHYGRGAGYVQYARGIRVFQVQRWNFEHEVGRYWNRGLRSYLRNETNFFAIEGRVWGMGAKWRPYPRDQGKFIAIRDGTDLAKVFGDEKATPWEQRFRHSMSLPFYQAHPDQLERIEDNFDMFYRNLIGKEVR
jgi:hypothetical protein